MIVNLAFGIDFRKNEIIFTYLKKSLGKIRLVDVEAHPILLETFLEEREAQVLSAINSFMSKHQIDRKGTTISIPREDVILRFIKLPISTKENLRKVIEYETSRLTPFEKNEIYFDYQLLKEDKEWLSLLVAFVKRAKVDSLLTLLRKIGIQPLSIQIPTVAALNLFYYHKGMKNGNPIVLIELNEPYVELNLLREKEWIESFQIPFSLGEKTLKIGNLLTRSGFGEEVLSKSKCFVYGSGMEQDRISPLATEVPIKEIQPPPLHRIDLNKLIPNPHKIYASIGLPLVRLTKTQFDLNLLPLEMRKKVKKIGKPLLAILLTLAFILGVIWGIGTYYQYRKTWSAINEEIRKMKPEVNALEKLQKQRDELIKEVSEFRKIEGEEISKIDLLREITQILPPTAWVWNLTYKGKEVEISGFADSASDLISLFDRSPLFEKVEFSAPVTKERFRGMVGGNPVDKEKERFKIKMRIEERRSKP